MNFLQHIANHICEETAGQFRDVLILVPNHRVASHLRRILRELPGHQGWLPELQTFPDWVMQHAPTALAPNATLITLLYDVYVQQQGDDRFEQFIGTAQTMLHDFDELDFQLVPPASFFRDLEQLKSLQFFLEDQESLTAFQLRYQRFWSLFTACYTNFKQLLHHQHLGYRGSIFREQAENLIWLQQWSDFKIYIVGFSQLSKSEEKIIDYLINQCDARFMADADTWYLDDVRHEAGDAIRPRLKKKQDQRPPWISNQLRTADKTIDVISVAKNIGQTVAAAGILQQLPPDSSTALILPDEKLLSPVMQLLPPEQTANITMGLPLKETSIAEFLNLWLDLITYAQKDNRQRFYHRLLLPLLQHPFTRRLATDETKLLQLQQYIIKGNKITLSQKQISTQLINEAALLDLLFDLPENHLQLLQQAIRLLEIISSEEKSTDPLEEIDAISAGVLLQTLRSLYTATASWQDQISTSAFVPLLIHELRQARIPFESANDASLQVMGIFETRALDVDHVIILSCNEGLFPTGKKSQSFIPFELRKAYGMPTHHERDANYSYLFYRILQRAKKVYLLYNTESDALGGGEPSRFILQIQSEWKHWPNIQLKHWVYAPPLTTSVEQEPILIRKTPEILRVMEARAANNGFSPSAINSYRLCTLQFYFRAILGLQEQDEVEEELQANTIGSAVHHVLEQLYQTMVGQQVTAAYLQQWLQQPDAVKQLVRQYLLQSFDEENLNEGKNYLLHRICETLASNFIRQEQERITASGQPVEITMLEQELQYSISVGPYRIQLKGFADRIENMGHATAIADYKTGKRSEPRFLEISDWDALINDPGYAKAFQLLWYAWLYNQQHNTEKRPVMSGIYWLRHGQVGFDALTMNKEPVLLHEADFQKFETVLKQIFTEMFHPEIPFKQTDDEKNCLYCDFKNICRRG
ncbi:MAG: PD-(D/E)XK nuclease family protein [Chitinophagales bacterium]